MDAALVIGCLDNVEARKAINRASRRLGVPYIDAGILELSVSVSVFGGEEANPCYECGLSEQQLVAARQRYSCDDTRREQVEAERVPTVQVAAALAGALQAQEAVRLLAGDRSMVGRRLVWHGRTNTLRDVELSANPACLAHARFASVTPLGVDSSTKLKDFLAEAARALGDGPAELDLSFDRSFVGAAACRTCGHRHPVMKPLHKLIERELRCFAPPLASCVHRDRDGVTILDERTPMPIDKIWRFSEASTPEMLGMTLAELGIPPRHIVPVSTPRIAEAYVALTAEVGLVQTGD